jgi:hypothetical protein
MTTGYVYCPRCGVTLWRGELESDPVKGTVVIAVPEGCTDGVCIRPSDGSALDAHPEAVISISAPGYSR